VPSGYLSKVLQSLARGELVHSQRGLHGGFALARPPRKISVWDVINAVDPLQRIRSCPLGLKSHGVNLCPMHRRLDDAMESVERAFRNSTVAELLADPNPSRPLCDFPRSTPKKR
jgi:Rrf2 family protein